MRIHYGFFMKNPRYWYDKGLMEADKLICKAASDLRATLAAAPATEPEGKTN
jgi:hypothetical protein